jgi:XTP/dITP diphosphohydrolase
VDALDGAPGLHSARYASLPNATDADRRAILLLNLSRNPRPWVARFRATVAIASPGRGVRTVEGVCPGEIIPEERGEGGFGYDPIFRLEGSDKTMAELDMEEKNRLSHRGQALRKAVPVLIELFKN